MAPIDHRTRRRFNILERLLGATGAIDAAEATPLEDVTPDLAGGGAAADNFLYLGTDAGGPITLTGTDSLATMLDSENDSAGSAFTHAAGLITVVEDSVIAISGQAQISGVDSTGWGQFAFDGPRTYSPVGVPRFYLATVPRVYCPASIQFVAAGTVIDTQLLSGNLAGSRSVTYAEVAIYKIL
jgi:hypothetical protein